MSYSYLSGLENGKHSISITNLQKLSAYFNVDLIYFLAPDNGEEAIFIGKDDRKCVTTDDGVSFKVITPGNTEKLQVTLVDLPAHSPSERRIHHHKEGEEFITVIEGKLFVLVGEKSYELEKGDSVFFKASLGHVIYTEDEPARFFLIVSPAYGKVL
jgi:quercetin dioxygenase-like cupin family protein